MGWNLYLWIWIGHAFVFTAAFLLNDGDPGGAVLALAAAGPFYLIAWNYRCPRCRTYLGRSREGWYGIGATIPENCVKCGRPKRGTIPFQWLVRPERAGSPPPNHTP